ncbi:retrovirus-related pol polyprotein from transposon TNT 1-94 [Tanacetum coccineum]
MIQVRLNATVRNIRTNYDTEFINQTLKAYYEEVIISNQTSVARTLQQNGIVERLNRTLVEAARTMLIFLKALLFLWAKAVATACYTQNRSLIRKHHNKTPYELPHDRKPDLSYLHVFGALYYPTNDGEDIAMASEKFSSGPGPKLLTPGTISLGLVPNIPSLTPYVPPTKNNWEILFQPIFDEYLNPQPYAPSTSTSQTTPKTPSPVIPYGVKEVDHDIEVAHMDDNPSVEFSIPEPSFEESFTQIEAMQEELNEFERFEVWELTPCPNRVMGITLKWIYNVKLDELGGVLKNKARLVAKSIRQEEGIDLRNLLLQLNGTRANPWSLIAFVV